MTSAQRREWWADYDEQVLGGVLGGRGLDAHLAYEADAKVERIYTLPFVPALLQITDYALLQQAAADAEADLPVRLSTRTRACGPGCA